MKDKSQTIRSVSREPLDGIWCIIPLILFFSFPHLLGIVCLNVATLEVTHQFGGVVSNDYYLYPNSRSTKSPRQKAVLAERMCLAALSLDATNADAWLGLGRSNILNGDRARASVLIGNAAQLAPQATLRQFELGWLHNHMGMFEQAITDWREANSLGYFINKGLMLERRKEWGKALISFHIALRINPASASAHRGYGWATYQAGEDWGDAYKHLAVALELDTTSFESYQKAGTMLEDVGMFIEAELLWRQAIRNVPQQQDAAYILLGRNLLYQGKYDEAVTELDAALAIAPDNPYANSYMGLLYYRTSQFVEAVTMYEKAIQLVSPNDPSAFVWRLQLARTHVLLGQYEQAVAQYELVLLAVPDHPSAIQELKELNRERNESGH